MNDRDKKLLYKLIELRNRDENTFGKVKRLASSAGDLRAAMLALEERLEANRQPQDGQGEAGAARTPDSLKGKEWEEFCARVGRSAPLRELFSSDIWRSADDDLPRAVATLAEFADLTPDPKHVCRTEDEAFMGALEDARKKNVQDAAGLLADIVADLIGIIYDHRDIAFMLYKLADPAHWRDVLKKLETGQGAGDDLPGEAAKNFNEPLGLLKDVPAARAERHDPHLTPLRAGRGGAFSSVRVRIFRVGRTARPCRSQPLAEREASVASARDALRDGRGDWSAYALFARDEALPKLRVLPPPTA